MALMPPPVPPALPAPPPPPTGAAPLATETGPGVLPPGVEPPCSGGLPLLALELPVLPPTRAPHAFP